MERANEAGTHHSSAPRINSNYSNRWQAPTGGLIPPQTGSRDLRKNMVLALGNTDDSIPMFQTFLDNGWDINSKTNLGNVMLKYIILRLLNEKTLRSFVNLLLGTSFATRISSIGSWLMAQTLILTAPKPVPSSLMLQPPMPCRQSSTS